MTVIKGLIVAGKTGCAHMALIYFGHSISWCSAFIYLATGHGRGMSVGVTVAGYFPTGWSH